MKVKCLYNTGMGFSKNTLLHMGCTIYTELPLCVNEICTVYGQIISRGILKYLIKGSKENLPSWYPAEIFEVVDPLLPMEWYFKYNNTNEICAIWGYQELVNDDMHLEKLIDREDDAIRIFLKRKKEIDEFSE